MAPKASSASSAAANRRKSGKAAAPASGNSTSNNNNSQNGSRNGYGYITLKVNSSKLRAIVDPDSVENAGEPSPSLAKESPNGVATANGTRNPSENPTGSNTPAAAGTPAASQNGVPPNGTPVPEAKKKGVKRAATGPNGEPKPRGKPGPKKKARLEDGSIDPNAPRSHKLGPKANQGAINAGLRALDRSGKPTRKWTKGTFKLKSFTGEVWELSRWRTGPKPKPEEPAKEVTVSTTVQVGAKNNKDNSKDTPVQDKSDKTPSSADVEMKDAPPLAVNGTTTSNTQSEEKTPAAASPPSEPSPHVPPAPVPVAAAS